MTDLEVLQLSEPVEQMYIDCTSQLVINLARHLEGGKELTSQNWRVKKLSELGALTEESAEIIAANTSKKADVIKDILNAAMKVALLDAEMSLIEASKRGIVSTSAGSFETSKRIQTVLTNLTNQAVDDTNLVNTVMLNSVQERYRAAISQITAYEEAAKEAKRIERLTSATNAVTLGKQMSEAQEVLNTAAGSTALGTASRTQAVRNAVKTLADKGITGFVDRGGHQWSPEAYVNMDVRTTVHNTAIQGQKARAEDYDVHTFQVSSKSAARPLCAPYQGKILSWLANDRGVVHDLRGKEYEYTSVYDTSYGDPGGLFGINCGHFPNTFIDGYSLARYEPLDEEGEKRNAEEYRKSQEQRRLERNVRKAKTEALAYDAAGDKEAFEQAAVKVKQATKNYKAFCNNNDLTERLDRVQVNGYNRSVSGKATWAARRQDALKLSKSSGGSSSEPGAPVLVGKVDFKDKSAVSGVLKQAKEELKDYTYEVNYTVTSDGRVWRVSGNAGDVNPSAIPSSLKGSYSYHNHPAAKTNFSFSESDVAFFFESGEEISIASDHKFTYMMRRTANTQQCSGDEAYGRFREIEHTDVFKLLWEEEIDPDTNKYHEVMKRLSKELEFEYDRRENK